MLAKNIQFPNRSTSARFRFVSSCVFATRSRACILMTHVASRRNDAPELAVVWRWQQESGMQPVSNHPPGTFFHTLSLSPDAPNPPFPILTVREIVWPGGERSWTAPLDGASCEPGQAVPHRSNQIDLVYALVEVHSSFSCPDLMPCKY